MTTIHTVKEGEYLIKIAKQYGFDDYRFIWDHPENVELKIKRGSPNALYAGDSLFIPDKETSTTRSSTGKRVVIRLRPKTNFFHVVLKNIDDEPLAYTPCSLKIEDKVFPHITSSDGIIAELIPAQASQGSLSISGVNIPLQIGELDPVDSDSGQITRLVNLGYYLGSPEEPDENLLKSAIEEFQCDQGISLTGICDAQTQSALEDAHGS